MAEAGHASRGGTNSLSHDRTHYRNASPIQHLEFHQRIAFQTTVNCQDIAVTPDGQVLLAALQLGMLVYNSNGYQLPSWLPPRQGNRDDVVSCVAALSDGRVAAGLGYAQLIVMLRLSNEDNSWHEEYRVTVHSPPMRVAVYGDVIAAANMTCDDTPGLLRKIWLPGGNLQILRLSTSTELCRSMTEYNIERIALTACCVVITSSGREQEVVEALSHAGERIWRRMIDQDEIVVGISAAHRWTRLYMCIVNKNLRSSRMMEISGVDGYEIRQIESIGTHGMLSVMSCELRTITAVLNGDPSSTNMRNVTLYETMNHLPEAAGPTAPQQFAHDPVRFKTPKMCWDMAATQDGHVLLACLNYGLFVYNHRGELLYIWKPVKQSNGEDDFVWCVAALINRRAAVGVQCAQLIVLLKSSETGDSWHEDRRVTVPRSGPCRLAVHGDLMAVAVFPSNQQHLGQLKCDRVVMLLRMCSGELLNTQSRDYTISRIALTTKLIVTKGHFIEVVEAFTYMGERVWRYVPSDNVTIPGLCVTVNPWNLVYMTMMKNDKSSGKVVAFGIADGKESGEVLSSSTLGLSVPRYVSLSQGHQRIVMAVLSSDRQTVLLYNAISGAVDFQHQTIGETVDRPQDDGLPLPVPCVSSTETPERYWS